jgi:catechol 2,3-dioxygenase-like lactoylglutathione lyase family enzyme
MEAFGKINQIGYVVRDLDATLDYWVNELGIGPWFVTKIVPGNCEYRGQPGNTVMRAAVSNSGDLQIELIQDLTEGPSFYGEFLDAGREGIHHISFWHAVEKYEAACKHMVDSGYKKVWSGETGGPEGACSYYENDKFPGIIFELSSMSDIKEAQFEYIAEEANSWDGTDPIRVVG